MFNTAAQTSHLCRAHLRNVRKLELWTGCDTFDHQATGSSTVAYNLSMHEPA